MVRIAKLGCLMFRPDNSGNSSELMSIRLPTVFHEIARRLKRPVQFFPPRLMYGWVRWVRPAHFRLCAGIAVTG